MNLLKDDDLLKSAILDAKTVREVALKNARASLEEAFAPRLQSMLSQRIQQEVEGDSDEEVDKIINSDDVETNKKEEPVKEPELASKENPKDAEKDETNAEPTKDEDSEVDLKALFADLDIPETDELESNEEETEETETPVAKTEKEPVATEGIEEDAEIDLDEIINELEADSDTKYQYEEDAELNEDADEEIDLDLEDDDVELDEEIDLELEDDSELDEDIDIELEDDKPKCESDEELDEDINIDEMLTALEEETDENDNCEELDSLRTENQNLKAQLKALKGELTESTEVIKSQTEQLSKLNIHNAKLVFATKLFRSHNLTEGEKIKIVESIDKAETINEAKLVYQTIDESFKSKVEASKNLPKSAQRLIESMASKPVLTTQPVEKKKIIAESDEMVARFQKLANINKK